jgi:hypothetical protein
VRQFASVPVSQYAGEGLDLLRSFHRHKAILDKG